MQYNSGYQVPQDATSVFVVIYDGYDGTTTQAVEVPLCGADPDTDGDGVKDSADNCKDDANGDQANADGDGQGDVCDADDDNDGVDDGSDECEGTASGTAVAADGCADPDGDGKSTHAGDNCPEASNGDQANFDGDAEGDACDADDDND